MRREVNLKVKSQFIHRFKSGYPLIFNDAIVNIKELKEEGTIVKLVDERNKFIARGYYGKQNKGLGWILSWKKDEKINDEFFEKKLSSAFNHREAFFSNPETTAFRVFNGEGDGIGGFTIDYFDGYYLINWYSQGIYKFKDIIVNKLKREINCKAVYQKKRFDAGGKYIEEDNFVYGIRGEFPIIVKENGINYAVYLNEGAMVGIFLDQKEVRRAIRDKYANGRTVLNTFSYTGAFSVAAALGGAKKTTSVDLANRSLDKTREQFSINAIDYQEQDIVVEDVFHYFKYANKKNMKFEMVILDPPSFARSKKFKFSAAQDYKDLLKEVIGITKDQGIIVASTNCSTFGMDKFKVFIHSAFKEMKCNYQLIEEYSLPSDFKTIKTFQEGNYLKVVFIKKLD